MARRLALVLATALGAAALAAPPAPAASAKDPTALLRALTLDEKITFVHGATDPEALGQAGYIPGVARLGIPPLRLTDGPAGIRVTKPATAMPAPVALGSAFDPGLAREFGAVIGRDGRALGQDVLLSPMVNTIRVPYGGRNFETFSEDPLVSADTVAAEVRGIQSQGLIATTKHFAENNQERDRQTVDVRVDDRTMREIELAGFEAAVRAGTGAIMCSYNKLNGPYACENPTLLTTILRSQWQFRGWVMSDWGATHSTAAIRTGLDQEMPGQTYFGAPLKTAIQNGTIPVSALNTAVSRILTQMGRFGLLACASPAGPVAGCTLPARPAFRAGDDVAQRVAEEGAVLLRNTGGALPLTEKSAKSLAVLGTPAAKPVLGGGGSSQVTPTAVSIPLNEIRARATDVAYSPGVEADGVVVPASALSGGAIDRTGSNALPAGQNFTTTRTLTVPSTGDYLINLGMSGGIGTLSVDGTQVGTGFGISATLSQIRGAVRLTAGKHQVTIDVRALTGFNLPLQVRLAWLTPAARQAGIDAAVKTAKGKTAAIVFAYDEGTEGADRSSLSLPFGQDALIAAVAAANPNTIVVLNTGSSVTMPWLSRVRSVLEMYYPGQRAGVATARLLFGDANPSGKLAQTFPVSASVTPVAGDAARYPGVNGQEQYSEGIYVGYRWYDAQRKPTLFPFGYGLSYTSFAYRDLRVHGNSVTFTVTNTGRRTGSEVAQVYVGPSPNVALPQAVRALAGFSKVRLIPGESRRVTVRLDARALSSWVDGRWVLGTGPRTVQVGGSSRSLPLSGKVTVR